MAARFTDVKAIFFDLDDTLCAYWDSSKVALCEAFAELGPERLSPEEMVAHWAETYKEFAPNLRALGWYERYLESGEPTRTEHMRRALVRMGIDDQDLASRLSHRYMTLRDGYLHLFPETEEVLQNLSRRFPLGLMTNGPADVQRQEVATLNLQPFFKHILIEGELGIGKPHEAVFKQAASLAGVPPTNLLFVGNSYHHDIAPALKFGWKAMWIRRASDVPPSAGGRGAPEALPPGGADPDAIISDLREVLALLEP